MPSSCSNLGAAGSTKAPRASGTECLGPAPTWEAMVDRHSTRVYRHAFRLTKNRQDAEDLTQETFIRVFRAWGSYKPGNVEGWLYRITTNIFLTNVQRARRGGLRAPFDEADPGLPDRSRSPAEIVDSGSFDPDVESALAALTAPFRAAVILSDVVGLSRDEIAGLLGLNPSTVGTRVFRGRQKLRDSLAHRRS